MSSEEIGGGNLSASPVDLSAEISALVGRVQKSVVEVRNERRGAGAGVILDESGLILTNAHLLAGGRQGGRNRYRPSHRHTSRRISKLTVALRDGREFGVQLVKSDRTIDLALLRLAGNPDGLSAARFGDSDTLRLGELVFAVGHPWGRLGAVTAGVVCDRPRRGQTAYVRSDVALAPGNSGGPLLNAEGEVVGINAMIFGGAALSIPSNAIEAWLAGTTRQRPRLGVGVLAVVQDFDGQHSALGLVVASVESGSPAASAGLMIGDVLLGADGKPLYGARDLLRALASTGGPMRLEIRRGTEVSLVDVNPRVPGPERAA